MKSMIRGIGRISGLALCVAATSIAGGQKQALNNVHTHGSPLLVEDMAGEWNVKQRMWLGPSTEPTALPRALAHRQSIGGTILQEQMELAPGEKGDPFTRVAYFEYNKVTGQYEYFSIDSRAPQMMNERSNGDSAEERKDKQPLNLWGGIFVAPKWGDADNVAFRYRLMISPVQENRQTVQLYLIPVSGDPHKEFLAFEYEYTRRP
ncbi:MAG: DUF1579 family protein [Acidobacteria bacterium]|nr:DUF1579 family protein [Acidobacteriota bacterium]